MARVKRIHIDTKETPVIAGYNNSHPEIKSRIVVEGPGGVEIEIFFNKMKTENHKIILTL